MLCGSCAVLRGRRDSLEFPVALAKGKHLFPFRTEKLSLSAPMVLGSQGPGRVGRRRFNVTRAAPRGGSWSLRAAARHAEAICRRLLHCMPAMRSQFDPEVSHQLERLAARAWPAEEVEEVEGWLLRRTIDVDRRR